MLSGAWDLGHSKCRGVLPWWASLPFLPTAFCQIMGEIFLVIFPNPWGWLCPLETRGYWQVSNVNIELQVGKVLSSLHLLRECLKYSGCSISACCWNEWGSERISLIDLGHPKRLPCASPLSILPLSNYPPDSYHQRLILLIHELHVNGSLTVHMHLHYFLWTAPARDSARLLHVWVVYFKLFSRISLCHCNIINLLILPLMNICIALCWGFVHSCTCCLMDVCTHFSWEYTEWCVWSQSTHVFTFSRYYPKVFQSGCTKLSLPAVKINATRMNILCSAIALQTGSSDIPTPNSQRGTLGLH